MKNEAARRNKSGSVLLSLLPVVVLGGVFGYLLAGDVTAATVRQLVASFSLGLALAFIALQWADLLIEFIALKRDPAPEALDFSDRDAVKAKMEKLGGRTAAGARVRHLPFRVHARVRAPRADHRDATLRELRERLLEHALHGASARLPLPAREVGAVVLHDDAPVRKLAQRRRRLLVVSPRATVVEARAAGVPPDGVRSPGDAVRWPDAA